MLTESDYYEVGYVCGQIACGHKWDGRTLIVRAAIIPMFLRCLANYGWSADVEDRPFDMARLSFKAEKIAA